MGNLYLEEVLVEFDIPLLFICIDILNNRYAVLCVDEIEQPFRYIIIKTDENKLLLMLKNKLTMRDFFLSSTEDIVWYVESSDEPTTDKITVGKASEISDDDLPSSGAYFLIDNKKINDYIKELEHDASENGSYEKIDIAFITKISTSVFIKECVKSIWFSFDSVKEYDDDLVSYSYNATLLSEHTYVKKNFEPFTLTKYTLQLKDIAFEREEKKRYVCRM